MTQYNFPDMLRVTACVPSVRPCDVDGNVQAIMRMATDASRLGADIVLFPELSVTGYTCADLFHDSLLLDAADRAIDRLAQFSVTIGSVIVVGAPCRCNDRLYNCAFVISDGKVQGVVPKSFLPDYNEFYEKRWFSSPLSLPEGVFPFSEKYGKVTPRRIFSVRGIKFGVEICEDLWVPAPPSSDLAMAGAEVILNLSASDALIGKHDYLLSLLANQSARCRCAYVYASAGFGESSTDLAFAGNAIIAENGRILKQSELFDTHELMQTADIDVAHLRHDRIHISSFNEYFPLAGKYELTECGMTENRVREANPLAYRYVDPTPFVDKDESELFRRCADISSIQAWGLATRLKAIGCRNVVIGISGGLDSTLALLVTVKAFDMLGLDRKGIHAITMPGFGTTTRTRSNADALMDTLGVTALCIPIGEAVSLHFRDIEHNPDNHDITYENSQARERTQILMDYANKVNGLVIGTGDLSELALGWCTYNGDQMSMYGVNASVPKTMVRWLVTGFARETKDKSLHDVLLDIVDTPISPELLPADSQGHIAQKTEDTVGPYELHDFFLYNVMRYGDSPDKIAALAAKAFDKKYDLQTIYKWLKTFYKRFFSQQFKRSVMPDGVKVGSICLSPRGDWRMPSDASARIWLDRIQQLIDGLKQD